MFFYNQIWTSLFGRMGENFCSNKLSSVMLTPYAGTFNFSFLNVLKVAINHSSSCLIQKLLETSVIIEFEANYPSDIFEQIVSVFRVAGSLKNRVKTGLKSKRYCRV